MIDETKLMGTDLPIAILANFPKPRFDMHDTSDLIQAIYEVKRSGHYDSLFANYAFEEEGRYPDSRVLSEALDTLQHTSYLERDNPYLVHYTVSKLLSDEYRSEIKKRLQTNELRQLKDLAKKVFARVKKSYSPSPSANA